MKKIIICISFLFIICLQTCYANNLKKYSESIIECAPELQSCLTKIQQLPEARKLIDTIQKEGKIRIITNKDPHLTQDFHAFWDPINRNITVHYSKNVSTGSLIGSIIFEMHNALVSSKMLHLDKLAAAGKIDRDAYVEAFERLEYKNSKDASWLVRKGIDQGLFPENAHLYTYSTFEEHFCVQKEAGHSDFIGRNFDHIVYQNNRRRFF